MRKIPDTMQGVQHHGRNRPSRAVPWMNCWELIALAIGCSNRCDACIGFHVKALIRLGVTREQLMETLGSAPTPGGGPTLMYAAEAVRALTEFIARPPALRPRPGQPLSPCRPPRRRPLRQALRERRDRAGAGSPRRRRYKRWPANIWLMSRCDSGCSTPRPPCRGRRALSAKACACAAADPAGASNEQARKGTPGARSRYVATLRASDRIVTEGRIIEPVVTGA